MSSIAARAGATAGRWLLLIHHLPAKPAYLRVKVWRRLHALGAVGVKNAVYALPASDQSHEDLSWLVREIADGGGEAFLCEARLLDGLNDGEVREMFESAREADYTQLARELHQLQASRPADAAAQLSRLRARLAQVAAIDFFGGQGRAIVEDLIAGTETRLGLAPAPSAASALPELQGRTWVTRTGVQVDRIASAWLIRRFVDPAARFKFVPAKGYVPQPDELRFDMFEAEFTHEGDQCTFEVLVRRIGGGDTALTAVAEIVHDIDLKDGKFGRAEAAGIGILLTGITAAEDADLRRIERGSQVFEDLYRSLGGGR